jgi:hypothetical protein
MSKRNSLFSEFLEYKQLMAAEELFKKKEEKKEDKKHWITHIKPETFLKIYVIMLLLFPFIGKAYTMLLLSIWK